MRILPVEKIPLVLWNSGILTLPVQLVSAYQTELASRNLLDMASAETNVERIYGGVTQAETEEHFARRFAVSAGRMEYASLDPSESFVHVSDALLYSVA